MGPRTFDKASLVVALLAFGATELAADTALTMPRPTLEFDGNIVRGVHIQAGGEALVVGISKEHLPFQARLVTYAEILVDADGDGAVELKLDNPVSAGSVWAVADLSTGKWHIAGPKDSPARKRRGHGSISKDGYGSLRRLIDQAHELEVVVVRPGTGAWRCVAGDGGPDDRGASNDGLVDIDLGGMMPVGTTEEFDELEPGDIVFAFEQRRLTFSVSRVLGASLQNVTDGEGE